MGKPVTGIIAANPWWQGCCLRGDVRWPRCGHAAQALGQVGLAHARSGLAPLLSAAAMIVIAARAMQLALDRLRLEQHRPGCFPSP